MNNIAFIRLVEDKTNAILSTKQNVGRQAIATTRGQQVEVAAEELLASHPNVESIECQVFDENIDEFSNIDLVINTKDGRRIYVPCARDLWKGTSQQDRLQIVWSKYKSGLFNDYDVVYLCLDTVDDILNKVYRKSARRGPTIKRCVQTLVDDNIIMNFDSLLSYLN